MVLAHPDGYRILQGSQTALIAAIRSGIGQPQDIARLVRWTDPIRKNPERLLAGADMTLQESLDKQGISGRIREEVLRPFFRLVFADQDLRTSYQFAMLVMQALLRGMPALPALGMQALPNQLSLGLERPVEHGVDVHGGGAQRGRGGADLHRRGRDPGASGRGRHGPGQRVLAAGPGHPGDGRPVDVVVHPGPPADDHEDAVRQPDRPLGRTPLARRRRVQHRSSLRTGRVATSWRPARSPMPGGDAGTETEAEVRAQLGQVFRTDATSWGLVTRHVKSAGWPLTRPPFITGREVDLGDGLFVAGDHREAAGIAGAMRAGRRAAAAVLEELGQPAEP